MRNLLAVLEYDGTEFQGFQSQKNGRTVQDELENALVEFLPQSARRGGRVKVTGGGRTDAGVHARGQTANFKLEWAHDLEIFRKALNAKLPTDIYVRQVREAPEKFSARFSATSRTYEYRVWNHTERDVFRCRYAHWVSEPLDGAAMHIAAKHLLGAHDFGAFGSAPQGDNTVRNLLRADVERAGDEIALRFEANAFLYRMVRRMVGTLLLVGRGTLMPGDTIAVLERKRRAGVSAPPQGLTLMEIKYGI